MFVWLETINIHFSFLPTFIYITFFKTFLHPYLQLGNNQYISLLFTRKFFLKSHRIKYCLSSMNFDYCPTK